MRRGIWAFALTLMMTATAWAQRGQMEVLVLPVEMPGYYNPIDSEDLTKTLETGIRKMAPNVSMQLARAADLTASGYRAGSEQPPTLEMADKLCRSYGASHICWVSIRFQPDYKPETGALALGGAARFWGYSADKRQVVFDQPLSLVRVGQVKNASDERAAKAAAKGLAEGCIGDLAYQIVSVARSRQVRPPASAASWTPPATNPATQSSNYKAMISATQAYQRAVKAESLPDITTTNAAMMRCWTVLNQAERDAISQNYPDLKDAMTQQPVYNYGGYYWPGY